MKNDMIYDILPALDAAKKCGILDPYTIKMLEQYCSKVREQEICDIMKENLTKEI